MVLELDSRQKSPSAVDRRVAQQAVAACGGDRRVGRVSVRVMRRPRRVACSDDRSARMGWRRPRLRELRAGDRGDREGERDGCGAFVGTIPLVAELLGMPARRRREQWLRRLATGEAIGAFALSAAGRGTDAPNQKTRAVKSGTGYRISGRKVGGERRSSGRRDRVRVHAGLRGRGDGVPRADGHAGRHANRARRFLGVRALRFALIPIARRRRPGPGPGRPGVRPRHVGAPGRARRDGLPGARHRRGGAGRSDRARQAPAGVRRVRSATPGDSVDARPTPPTELEAARLLTLARPRPRKIDRNASWSRHRWRSFGVGGGDKAADKAMQILASADTAAVGRRAFVPRRARDRDVPGDVGSAADDDRRGPPRQRVECSWLRA